MTAFTIVTVVRALIAAGQTDAQIGATVQTMLFDNAEDAPLPFDNRGGDRREVPNGDRGPDRRTADTPHPFANTPGSGVPVSGSRGPRRGGIPAVNYRIAGRLTATQIRNLQLPPQQEQIALLVLDAGRDGLGRREITERLGHKTHKVTESAVYALRVRNVLESVALDAEPPAPAPAPRRAAKTAPARRGVSVKAKRR